MSDTQLDEQQIKIVASADETETSTLPFFGETYRVDAEIGKGAWSTVYRGWHIRLNKPVAIKALNVEIVSTPEKLKRFEQEARVIGDLNHQNIVRVYDFGCTGEGVPFTVMELAEGQSIREALASGALDREQSINIAMQMSEALNYAHAHSVVHRDIKPDNILIDGATGRAKLVDFGIAKAATEEGAIELTQTGEVLGTPQYMSPEQCAGKRLDGKTDIYSLGCVLFELLTGQPPFTGKSTFDVLRQHMETPPPAVPSAGVLEKIIQACLAKEPIERPSAAELRSLLDAAKRQQTDRINRILRDCKRRGRTPEPLGAKLTKAFAAVAVLAIVGVGASNIFHKAAGPPLYEDSEFVTQLSFIEKDIEEAGLGAELREEEAKFDKLSEKRAVVDDQMQWNGISIDHGDATVNVNYTARPISLVLRSNNPAKWHLRINPNARVTQIYVVDRYGVQHTPPIGAGLIPIKYFYAKKIVPPPSMYSDDNDVYYNAVKRETHSDSITMQGCFDGDKKTFEIGPRSKTWRAQYLMASLDDLHRRASAQAELEAKDWLISRGLATVAKKIHLLPGCWYPEQDGSPPDDPKQLASAIKHWAPNAAASPQPYSLVANPAAPKMAEALIQTSADGKELNRIQLRRQIPLEDEFGEPSLVSFEAPYVVAVTAAPWELGRTIKKEDFVSSPVDHSHWVWLIDPKKGKIMYFGPIVAGEVPEE